MAKARKSNSSESRGSVLSHAVLALFALYIALPPLWVLRTSFVPESAAYSISVMPEFTLDNYVKLLVKDKFWLAYMDSLIAATASTALALPLAAMAGYAFARYRTGGNAGRFFVLATQMLPPVAIVLPVFTLFRLADLTNSVTGLVIAYTALNLPFLTWILMGFFLAWNEFLFALVLTGPDTATIPVVLASLQSQNGVQIAEVSAGVVLGVLPLLIASRFIQNYLVRGLTFGAIK